MEELGKFPCWLFSPQLDLMSPMRQCRIYSPESNSEIHKTF
ncbi:hypothetical protein SAMN04488061_1570 [Filomicrobium insigne]|uniref:Uncharacterized protein n=1 Tax=Filomicrobium insigne TaxID=418854 RepID=A0A1H0M525_9HYPH|nr:hypothetical protein SAMN04488061_1570 [Filomicrobium insigne]